jgi:hypothetical protein|tara:strand:+ start:233 stop:487 length:255 start_codon:yes stop_codon:yes gene_type:complete
MPVNDIIQHAMDNNPLKLKQAFDDDMTSRVRTALNTKYNDMTAEAPAVADLDAHFNDAPDHTRNEPAITLPEETVAVEEESSED